MPVLEAQRPGRIERKIANLARMRAHHGAARPSLARRSDLAASTIVLYPSGDSTGVADYDAIMAAGPAVQCMPGSWYLSNTVAVGPQLSQMAASGAASMFLPGSSFTGTGLFTFGSGGRLTGLAADINGVPLVDFGNTWVSDIEIDHLTINSSSGPAFTNLNFHRSALHGLYVTQNDPSTPWIELGTTGTGVSTATFRDIVAVGGCDGNGNRSSVLMQVIAAGQEDLDELRFEDCFSLNNTNNAGQLDNSQYVWDIGCSGGPGIYGDRLIIRNCDFGRPLGGALRVRAFTGVELDWLTVGNTYTQSGRSVAKSLVSIGAYGGSGQPSECIDIKGYVREGAGPLVAGASPYDIQVWSGCDQTTITNPRSTGGLPVQIMVTGTSNVVAINPAGAQLYQQAADTTEVGGVNGVTLGGNPLVGQVNHG